MADSVDASGLQALLPEPARAALDTLDGADSACFADIGLTSMQLIQFVTSVESTFGVEFSPDEFLRLPRTSLAQAAELVAGKVAAHD